MSKIGAGIVVLALFGVAFSTASPISHDVELRELLSRVNPGGIFAPHVAVNFCFQRSELNDDTFNFRIVAKNGQIFHGKTRLHEEKASDINPRLHHFTLQHPVVPDLKLDFAVHFTDYELHHHDVFCTAAHPLEKNSKFLEIFEFPMLLDFH